MTRRMRRFGMLGVLVALSGCATANPPQPEEAWTGGDATHLAADQADCRKESDAIDVHQAANYTDPRYGVTSAMAAAVADNNPMVNTRAATKRAAYEACMNDKGWKSQ